MFDDDYEDDGDYFRTEDEHGELPSICETPGEGRTYRQCPCYQCKLLTAESEPSCGCKAIVFYESTSCDECPKRTFCAVAQHPEDHPAEDIQTAWCHDCRGLRSLTVDGEAMSSDQWANYGITEDVNRCACSS